jgi:6-phosphogluconolactonase (cycloisomerase 2 family)
MNHRVLVIGLAALFAALLAQGASGAPPARSPVVFVQTNETSGNRIITYDVGTAGTLTQAGAFATGGAGGVAAPGTETDHLASQGSLAYDAGHGLLFAVNAGSDTVSTFSVSGDTLHLSGIVPSGGEFPSSVAVSGKLVYVLNAGGSGTVQGFRIAGDKLQPIPGSGRDLGLANAATPNFLTAPGQVGFTPDGRALLVTTKASGSTVDVFSVGPDGRLSAQPVQNASATPVPFAFTFTPDGRLADGEAGASSLTTYAVGADGRLADAKTASDGQAALCWVQRVGSYYYVSNTGSNNVSAFTVGADGQPSLVGTVATTEPGPIDLTSPTGTSYLYVETGNGTVDEFLSHADGSLTPLGTVTGLPAGIEGIAST